MSSTPSTTELVILGAPIVLRDGSHVRIRQGRHDDRELLLRGFERLGHESRYRRFLTPVPELTDEMARNLTDVDHHDHEAMIAIDEQTGEGVGVARYVRDRERPQVAEVAVTVIDDWQGRELGTLLLEVISARAREQGITTFTALMLASNDEMMDLFKHLGAVRMVDRGAGSVQVEGSIPEIGVALRSGSCCRSLPGRTCPHQSQPPIAHQASDHRASSLPRPHKHNPDVRCRAYTRAPSSAGACMRGRERQRQLPPHVSGFLGA